MNGTTAGTLSRRNLTLLAAALLATFATALGTLGGLAQWSKQAAPPAPTAVVQQAPAQHWTGEAD